MPFIMKIYFLSQFLYFYQIFFEWLKKCYKDKGEMLKNYEIFVTFSINFTQ